MADRIADHSSTSGARLSCGKTGACSACATSSRADSESPSAIFLQYLSAAAIKLRQIQRHFAIGVLRQLCRQMEAVEGTEPEQIKLKCALERGCWASGWNRFQWVQVPNVRVDGRIRRSAERRLGQLLRRSFCCEPFPLCIARSIGAFSTCLRHSLRSSMRTYMGAPSGQWGRVGGTYACRRGPRHFRRQQEPKAARA